MRLASGGDRDELACVLLAVVGAVECVVAVAVVGVAQSLMPLAQGAHAVAEGVALLVARRRRNAAVLTAFASAIVLLSTAIFLAADAVLALFHKPMAAATQHTGLAPAVCLLIGSACEVATLCYSSSSTDSLRSQIGARFADLYGVARVAYIHVGSAFVRALLALVAALFAAPDSAVGPLCVLSVSALVCRLTLPVSAATARVLLLASPSAPQATALQAALLALRSVDGVLEVREQRFWHTGPNEVAGAVVLRVRVDAAEKPVRDAARALLAPHVAQLVVQVEKDWLHQPSFATTATPAPLSLPPTLQPSQSPLRQSPHPPHPPPIKVD